ncbi:MAG: hypothetical protein J5877_05900 [Clostridia bacterium]|nr:hypothetical protein [Clostridia bacterium]
MKLINKKFLKTVSVILILTLVISLFSSCGGVRISRHAIASVKEKTSEFTDAKYHKYDKKSAIFVAKSGLIELYFDKASCSVAIKDTAADRTWYSVPAFNSENENASVLTVRLSDKSGNVWLLNSQDSSVAFGSAGFDSLEGGISLIYRMALDAETAKKDISELPKGTPAAEVKVDFSLADGSFYVSVKDENIKVPDGINIESITVFDYLTSTEKVSKDDYIFIPDGCGAIIKNSLVKEKAQYNVPVYSSNDVSPASAVLPAFGVKQGDAAFMALVESGDESCEINAFTGSKNSVSGRAGVSFNVTEMKYRQNKNGKYTVWSGMRSGDELRICYRFLSGNNASYASFSTACREMLIRNSALSVKSVEETEYYPIFVGIDSAVSVNKRGTKTLILSTFEETEDIISQLKAKGINNAYVDVKNALNGANEQYDIKNAKLNPALGKKSDFEALYSYVSIQKMKLLLDISLVSSNTGSGGFSSSDCLKDITGKKALITGKNDFSEIVSAKNTSYRLLKPGKTDNRVSSLLKNFQNIPVSGYCVNDYAFGLVSDYSGGTSASVAADETLKANSSLATERLLAVERGNFNSVKGASLVTKLPSDTGYEQNESYVAVPFAEMVLHGTADYTFEPINASADTRKALLRCVEYGAIPSFEWFYRETGDELLDKTYKYDNSINIAADYYQSALALNPLRSLRITDHSFVSEGVYLVEYSDGSMVYVNYNEKDVEVNDILIGAEDFVVIS